MPSFNIIWGKMFGNNGHVYSPKARAHNPMESNLLENINPLLICCKFSNTITWEKFFSHSNAQVTKFNLAT